MNMFNDYLVKRKISGKDFDYYILEKNNKKYFLKLLKNSDEEFKENLKKEIAMLSLVKSFSFIPNVFEYNIETSNSFIIYDYIEGKTLDKYENLSDNMIINILIVVASYLEKLHEKNIAHCDIKPSNIMIDYDGNIFIIDMGNATTIGEKVNFGTKRYCSLEQLECGIASIKFDIYSLGIVMYELLTGKVAFSKLSDEELKEVKKNNNLSIKEFNSSISSFADEILKKALNINNTNNYINMRNFINDLYILKKTI